MEKLRVYEHRRIVDAIAVNLRYDALVESKNRKRLDGIIPGFEYDPPLWELKIGIWRVFYDFDEEARIVYVRAVRQKPPAKQTAEIVI